MKTRIRAVAGAGAILLIVGIIMASAHPEWMPSPESAGLINRLLRKGWSLIDLYANLLLILSFLILLFACFPRRFSAAAGFIVKYRWPAAAVLFACCVLLRLHGSSMAMYDSIFPTHSDEAAAEQYYIWGQIRNYRTDEYGVSMPAYFSQSYNDYRMQSTRMSLSPTNMVLDYYAPVRDITAIGKPFTWGYLLFGNEVGVSWYWCGMTILMFLISFEMFMILTRGCKAVSAAGMLLVGLSPAVQWWFLPHIPIVYLYAMDLFVIGYYFFTARSAWMKWLTVLTAVIAGTGFVLSFFPSCQVTAGLAAAALLAACLVRDRDRITFKAKDWYRIGIVVVIAGGILGRFLLLWKDDLHMLLSTVYPGARMETGGGSRLSDLFTDLRTLFLPYHDSNILNNCEMATWIHLAPAFCLLFPQIYLSLRKKKDRNRLVGAILFLSLLVEIDYMCFGFSETMARLTLFRYANRMKLTYGWTAVLFTVWSADVIWKTPGILKKWEIIAVPAIYGIIYCSFIDESLLQYLPRIILLAEILLFVLLLFAILCKQKIFSICLTTLILCGAGLTVNPLSRGISPITNHPVSEFISSKALEEPDGLWLPVGTPFFVNNFLLANGARVIGATNFYMDTERWKLLDPNGVYADSYNRYSNQIIYFTEEETSVELEWADSIRIMLNPDDLYRLGIRYIFTPIGPDEMAEWGIRAAQVFTQDSYYIYQLDGQ